jgi:5-methylcytosine-specific restriction endonuclease McrA
MTASRGKIESGQNSIASTVPALTIPSVEVMSMAVQSLPETTKQCTKCGEVKPLSSFPRRYGRSSHLRQHTCGYCKTKAHRQRHPEKKRIETHRARARAKGMTVEEYAANLAEKQARVEQRKAAKELAAAQIAEFGVVLKVKKRRRTCPIVQVFKAREQARTWYWNNLERGRGKTRRWKKDNPAKLSAQHYRRRVQYRPMQCDLTEEEWASIQQAYSYRCAYCGEHKPLTQDHVIPVSRGGQYTALNIVPACRSCNSSKGNRLRRLPVIQEKKRYFPR